MRKMQIAPSLLSADFLNLERELARMEEAGADLVHLDIMDGQFVPNLTFGAPIIARLKGKTRLPLDAHVMAVSPERLIGPLSEAGCASVAIHYEACAHLHRAMDEIRSCGMAAGIALNPSTPLSMLQDCFGFCDYVLIMTVDPGFSGQRFIPALLPKIAEAAAKAKAVSCDGGIDMHTGPQARAAGATTLICGSYAFQGDLKANLMNLRIACGADA